MTVLRSEPYVIPASTLGPENPVPTLREPDPDARPFLDDKIPPEDQKNIGGQTTQRVLPYKMQDSYEYDMTMRSFDSLVLENEYLKAVFLPEMGGRLASLYHKPSDTELLEPVRQVRLANFALRNAWFACGVEWNTAHMGHHPLTCSPIFAARLCGGDGEPVLRMYAWERMKGFPYSIDFHLPPESRFLFAQVRLCNVHNHEIPMYWWTNIGVTEAPGRRVLVPADTAIHNLTNGEHGFALTDVPAFDGYDLTYTTNIPCAKEFFFRVPENRRRWIASLDEQGRGLVQTSTSMLKGRKLFAFGTGQGGERWQEFLLGSNKAYKEIQAGLTVTQLESIPMPAGAEWMWTEAFGLIDADPRRVHGDDWSCAGMCVETRLAELLPEDHLDDLNKSFSITTHQRPDEVIFHGDGWGALERRLHKTMKQIDPIPSEFVFEESTLGADQQQWLALIEQGALPDRDALSPPGSYMIDGQWRVLLEKSISHGHGNSWVSWLHLGIMWHEALDPRKAREAWQKSNEIEPNAWALQNLAVLAQRDGQWDKASELLQRAWEIGPALLSVAVDYVAALQHLNAYSRLAEFLDNLPKSIKHHERMLMAAGKLALETGNMEKAEWILDHDFVSIREGETVLTDLWFALQARKVSFEENLPCDDQLLERVRRECVPPKKIDFRMLA
ncbi:MAG: DUF5107 domain-containing protein [Armatimonadota bacterium]|nr:DUF5107 domain-containing protein [bacterium]